MLTASLAVAAHSAGGGGLPSGSGVALLTLVAITLGALVTAIPAAANAGVLLAALAVGQLLGHVVLGAAGHTHSPSTAAPAAAMVAAHAVAVAVGAVLISVGGHLCAALSRAIRRTARPAGRPVHARSTTVVGSADQPLQSTLRLVASVSRRGPPVGSAS